MVQETLLEGWQCLGRLRSLEQGERWLDGICRNVCRRWHQRQLRRQAHHLALHISSDEGEADEVLAAFTSPDPALFDPAEELDRQDRENLLERALSQLSLENRRAVEFCYLRELPQREAALCLGMTISALEARLHRARRQLQQIFSSTLRSDAEACGLALRYAGVSDDASTGWRESRAWCDMCGKRRLYGNFTVLPDGRVRLWMRCPVCSMQRNSAAVIGLLPSGEWRSFRPAIKRVERWYQEFVVRRYQMGRPGICDQCGAENAVHLMSHAEYLARFCPGSSTPSPEEVVLPLYVFQCQQCSTISTGNAWSQALLHPLLQRFKERHPRSFIESIGRAEYAGCSTLRLRLTALYDPAHINAFLHLETMQVLAVIEEE